MAIGFQQIPFFALAGGVAGRGTEGRTTHEGVTLGLASATTFWMGQSVAIHLAVNPPLLVSIIACATAVFGTMAIMNCLEGRSWQPQSIVIMQLITAVLGYAGIILFGIRR